MVSNDKNFVGNDTYSGHTAGTMAIEPGHAITEIAGHWLWKAPVRRRRRLAQREEESLIHKHY